MRRMMLVTLTLVMAVVLAACGGQPQTAAPAQKPAEQPKAAAQPTSAPAAQPTRAPAAQPTSVPKATDAPKLAATAEPAKKAETAAPIRIGASLSLTGRLERTGKEQQNGYNLWVDEVNAAGGVLGRRVQLVIYDDKSDPETGAKLYEKLITEDLVDLVLGPYGSPVALAASTVTEKYKYAMLAPGASASEIWGRGYKYVFAVYAPAPNYLTGAIELGKGKGYKTAVAINENSAFAKDTIRGAVETAKAAGFNVVFQEEYSRDVKDLTPTLTKIKALNPDIVLAGTYGEDATLIVRQLKDLNWAPKMLAMTVGPALPDFYTTLKADAEYVMGASQWEPSIKGVEKFVDAYKAKYGYEPGYHAAGGYGAGQLLKQALEKAGAVDNEKLREALQTGQYESTFGPYKVDATGNNTAGAIYLVQWQKGERKVVWPDKAANAQAIIPMPAWNAR